MSHGRGRGLCMEMRAVDVWQVLASLRSHRL